MVFKRKKHIITLSDEEILYQWNLKQKKVYWEVLYERYIGLCYGVCLKYLKDVPSAEDASMEIFLALPHKIKGTEINQFKAWFYRVIKNHCLMELRKKNPVNYQKELPIIECDTEEAEDSLTKEQLLNGMETCMLDLKLEQRICIEQFYIKEKSYQEIVEETGYELKKVKSYIQNGKRNLRLCLEKNR